MSTKHATIKATSIQITLPATDQEPEAQILVVDLEIACPDCGEVAIRVAGHHLKGLRDILVQVIDEFSTLCGHDDGITVQRRSSWQGRSGGSGSDPSMN